MERSEFKNPFGLKSVEKSAEAIREEVKVRKQEIEETARILDQKVSEAFSERYEIETRMERVEHRTSSDLWRQADQQHWSLRQEIGRRLEARARNREAEAELDQLASDLRRKVRAQEAERDLLLSKEARQPLEERLAAREAAQNRAAKVQDREASSPFCLDRSGQLSDESREPFEKKKDRDRER